MSIIDVCTIISASGAVIVAAPKMWATAKWCFGLLKWCVGSLSPFAPYDPPAMPKRGDLDGLEARLAYEFEDERYRRIRIGKRVIRLRFFRKPPLTDVSIFKWENPNAWAMPDD